MTNFTILLSHERSGSHLLGEYIASLSGATMFDEVCNARSVKPSDGGASYHRFRHEAILRDPQLVLEPTRERHTAFVRSYFDHLSRLRPNKNVVVDIKY